METSPAHEGRVEEPAPPLDLPILAVYEAKNEEELQKGVWSSGCVVFVLASIGTAYAFVGEVVGALISVGMGLGMWFLFRMSQRMKDTNARLSFNSRQLMAETPERNVIHDFSQLRVINRIQGQGPDSKSCIFNIAFKDGTVYWLYGEHEVNAFVTQLREVSRALII